MKSFRSLLGGKAPILLPGAHDALSARLIELAGFQAYGIGGAALSCTQLALPDAGLQSFGEYRDSVRRVMEGSTLPVMVDGENGFGDVKAVTRTVRSFEAMGVSGIALEDLVFPPALDRPPTVIPLDEMTRKLEAALAARSNEELFIIGRSDAAYAVNLDEALKRIRRFEEVGVDSVLVTGLTDIDSMHRVRDAVRVPIVAVIVEGSHWLALPPNELARMGFEIAIYPATLMIRVATAIRDGLDAINAHNISPQAQQITSADLSTALRISAWADIDARFAEK